MNKRTIKINGEVERLEKRLNHFTRPQKMEVEYISTFVKKGAFLVKHTIGYFMVGKVYKSTSSELNYNESYYEPIVGNKLKRNKNNGNYYLELHTMRNQFCETTYTVNGEVVDKETYNSYLPPSKKVSKPKKYFIVKAENVISIR